MRGVGRQSLATTARGWIIAVMLFLFMTINFADKAVLGLAAISIMRDLHLSHSQFGLIGTGFFAFFSFSAIALGFVANRAPTKWMLAGMALVWSMCQLPLAFVATWSTLVISRVLLGLGEGGAYPVALHAAYKWFPNERRAVPTGLIAIGGAAGTGVVAPIVSYVIAGWSWQAAFGALGVVGLVWCAAWLVVGRESPGGQRPSSAPVNAEATVPYRTLLASRTVLGVQIAGFSAYLLLTLAVVWLPPFLGESFGYDPRTVGLIVTLPALCQIVFVPLMGAVSQRLRRHGVSSRLARGGLASLCVTAAGLLSALLPMLPGPVLPIICLAATFSIGNVIFVLGHVMVAEVTPVGQRAAMLGITNALITLAGPLLPIAMGLLVDFGASPAGGYRTGFTIVGILVTAGGLAGFILINPEADLRVRVGSLSGQPTNHAAVKPSGWSA